MSHQTKSQANLRLSGGIVAIGLVLPRSQPVAAYRVLLALLPFLALGRSAGRFDQEAVPGRHNLSTMPWPEPRGWEGASPAPPGEVHIHRREAGPAGEAASRLLPTAPVPVPGERPEILAALAPGQRWGQPGPGNAMVFRPAGTVGAFQTLFGLASGGPGVSRRVHAAHQPGIGQHSGPWRPATTAPAGIVDAASSPFQALTASPVAALPPASQRSGAAPVRTAATPVGSPGFTTADPAGDLPAGAGPGLLTERSWQVLPTQHPGGPAIPPQAEGGVKLLPLPVLLAGRSEAFAGSGTSQGPARSGLWPRPAGPGPALARPPAYPPVNLPWSGYEPDETGSPPAPDSSALAGAGPAPRGYPAEPGPYAAASGRGLVMAADTLQAIERLVVRQVETQVARQAKTLKAQVSERLVPERRLTVTELVSDEVVQALMQKMRALAHEERFRLGRLR